MRHARSRLIARGGFTLLEAVVALLVLGSVSVAALGAVSSNLRATERANRVLTGAALAEDRLAALRLVDAAELMPLADSLRGGRFGGELSDYEWTAEVTRSASDPDLVRASVTVAWAGGAETLETLLLRECR